MRLNADFSRPARVNFDESAWRPSPQAGVERLMLDRIGEEKARATSLVRYAPDSRFPEHRHDLGEEFLVLEGVFSDASGDYGPGSYVRNPPGTAHAPWSEPGSLIFVKLRQFDLEDLTPVAVDTANAEWQAGPPPGVAVLPLHEHPSERVRLLRLAPGAGLAEQSFPGGAELLVVEGACAVASERLDRWDWLRLPPGATATLASETGCTLYLKTGHLSAALAA